MEPLLPVRHTERDFFTCDIFEALTSFKDDMVSMEHPVFSLATKPDTRTLRYEHNGNTITIIPSTLGLATIFDKDILLYCASQLRAAINRGEIPSQRVRFAAYDFFVSTNRLTTGQYYQNFEDCLNRLRGTTINTNIKTGGVTIVSGFGLIDSWNAIKRDDRERAIAVEIKVSDWFYNSIIANELLTINRDYFRIRKPIERRIYEISRKHCGDAPSFKIGLDKLHKKTGSSSSLREFRRMVGKTITTNHLPDYEIAMSDDMVTFTNRNRKDTTPPPPSLLPLSGGPLLRPETYERAKTFAPGWDVYALAEQWREWVGKKGMPKNPDGAFIGFCKKKGPYR